MELVSHLIKFNILSVLILSIRKCPEWTECPLSVWSGVFEANKAQRVFKWTFKNCLLSSPQMRANDKCERYFKKFVFNYSLQKISIKIMNISEYISCIIHIYRYFRCITTYQQKVSCCSKHVSKTKIDFAMWHPYMHIYWIFYFWIYLQLAEVIRNDYCSIVQT
jgi:hypothetical protein